MLCITYFDYFFLSILCMTLSLTSIFSISHNAFHIPQFKKMSLLTGVYGHVGHQILHKEENNRRINTALVYYPKDEELLLYCSLFAKHLEEYTKKMWARGLRTEAVTEDKVWDFYSTKHIGIKVNNSED